MPARNTLPARRDAIETTARDDDEANGDAPKGSPKTIKHAVKELDGEEFRLYTQVNAFQSLAVVADPDDVAPMYFLILGLVHEQDRPRFKRIMGMNSTMTAPKLTKIFEGMLQAVSGANPTRTSSASRRSAAKAVGTRRSVAASSSRATTRKR
jgi:hypothetical protein